MARLSACATSCAGTVIKATPEIASSSAGGGSCSRRSTRRRARYLPAADTPVAFFIRPEYVRLIRKDRPAPIPGHHMNLMRGPRRGRGGLRAPTWTLCFRLDAPGPPGQGDYDLEIEVPKLVYEMLDIARDRRWAVSMHRGSIQVLPTS